MCSGTDMGSDRVRSASSDRRQLRNGGRRHTETGYGLEAMADTMIWRR